MSARALRWAHDLFSTTDLIPPQERSILVWLCYHHNDKTGRCIPAAETLSMLTGYRRQRVFDGLRTLEELGIIKRSKRTDKGYQTSNEYGLFGRIKRPDGGTNKRPKKRTYMRPDGGTEQTSPPVTHDRDTKLENVTPFIRRIAGRGSR